MQKIMSLVMAVSLFFMGCSNKESNVLTFREQAIQHHKNIQLVFEDASDGILQDSSRTNMENVTKWLESLNQIESMKDEEKKVAISISEEANKTLDFYKARASGSNDANLHMFLYVVAKSVTEELLGLKGD